jgi:hypothetical protein
MTEEQPKSEQPEGYEPPEAEELDTKHQPAVTAAGDQQSHPGDTIG